MSKKVLIDCDPGIDDAMAIFFAVISTIMLNYVATGIIAFLLAPDRFAELIEGSNNIGTKPIPPSGQEIAWFVAAWCGLLLVATVLSAQGPGDPQTLAARVQQRLATIKDFSGTFQLALSR